MNDLQFSPYQLPQNTPIPSAYGQDYFNTLQGTLGSEQQNQANNLLRFQQSHNLLGPGDTNTGLLSQVLGSPQQQINRQILPTALGASFTGQGQQFQSQMQAMQFQQQLQQLQQAFAEQENLMSLYNQLLPHGYRQSFGQSLGSNIAGDVGQMIPGLASNAGLAAMMGG